MGVVLKVEGNVYDLKGWSGVVVIICMTWIVLVLSEVQNFTQPKSLVCYIVRMGRRGQSFS